MAKSVKTIPIEVVCPVCGKRWLKPIMTYGEPIDDTSLRFLSHPTCCSKECREKRWKQIIKSIKMGVEFL